MCSFMNFPSGVLNFSISRLLMRQLTLSADTGRTWKEIMTFRLYSLGKSCRGKNYPDISVVTEIYNLNIGTNCVTRKV